MKMVLKRTDFRPDGIFSRLLDENGQGLGYFTLEHAYPQSLGANSFYKPKLPVGTYTCVRGRHTLDHHPEPFDAFEVTGVAGHSGILFHKGNFNRDSDGCILLGDAFLKPPYVAEAMVTDSSATFDKFMRMLTGTDSFTLEVL